MYKKKLDLLENICGVLWQMPVKRHSAGLWAQEPPKDVSDRLVRKIHK